MENASPQVGRFNTLPVVKSVDFGLYLDGGPLGEILLPKRFAPSEAAPGDELEVFLYHDSDNRLIATTQKPIGTVGDIVAMRCVSKTKQGAFMDWGLMKDLFVPLSQQMSRMHEGEKYLILIYIDEQTGRVAGTEKFNRQLSNEPLTVVERELVDILVWRQTDIGYAVIVNNKHTGVVHYSDVFEELEVGDKKRGYIKTIRPENKLDIALGERGYGRVTNERDRILEALRDAGGYLALHDRSDPEEIYALLGMSKKVFKMAVGALYRERKIELAKAGIKLAEA
jgi:predicted RNA-binding protein (virulence factor B family)